MLQHPVQPGAEAQEELKLLIHRVGNHGTEKYRKDRKKQIGLHSAYYGGTGLNLYRGLFSRV